MNTRSVEHKRSQGPSIPENVRYQKYNRHYLRREVSNTSAISELTDPDSKEPHQIAIARSLGGEMIENSLNS